MVSIVGYTGFDVHFSTAGYPVPIYTSGSTRPCPPFCYPEKYDFASTKASRASSAYELFPRAVAGLGIHTPTSIVRYIASKPTTSNNRLPRVTDRLQLLAVLSYFILSTISNDRPL